jgi:DNA-binding MarR family transcriptional regulator
MDHGDLSDSSLGRLVGIAGHLAGQRWSRYLAEQLDLTPAGARVLTLLERDGGHTHQELARLCFVRPATLTGVVDTLTRQGHVERRRHTEDRRVVNLGLTPSGVEKVKAIAAMATNRATLTPIDADPANEAIIRAFLVQLIQQLSNGEETR